MTIARDQGIPVEERQLLRHDLYLADEAFLRRIGYLVEHGYTRAEAALDAQDEWGEHVNAVARGTMFTADSCNSWYNGANIEMDFYGGWKGTFGDFGVDVGGLRGPGGHPADLARVLAPHLEGELLPEDLGGPAVDDRACGARVEERVAAEIRREREKALGAESIRVAGTSAVRDAVNGDDDETRLSAATGKKIRAQLKQERKLIRDSARDFTMKEVLPAANRLDPQQGMIPMELRQKMADMGYFGIVIPEQFGGLGLGVFEYCLITEELARAWMSVASIIARGNGLSAGRGMTDAQRKVFLPRAARGEFLGAAAMSEPNSDPITRFNNSMMATKVILYAASWNR